MNKRKVGTEWEQYAAEYLKNKGYEILQMNYRCKVGEIDIIACRKVVDHIEISFVEVKYRSSDRYGSAIEAVGIRKQQTVRRVAQYYLMQNHYDDRYPYSFDVIAIDQNRITHLVQAF